MKGDKLDELDQTRFQEPSMIQMQTHLNKVRQYKRRLYHAQQDLRGLQTALKWKHQEIEQLKQSNKQKITIEQAKGQKKLVDLYKRLEQAKQQKGELIDKYQNDIKKLIYQQKAIKTKKIRFQRQQRLHSKAEVRDKAKQIDKLKRQSLISHQAEAQARQKIKEIEELIEQRKQAIRQLRHQAQTNANLRHQAQKYAILMNEQIQQLRKSKQDEQNRLKKEIDDMKSQQSKQEQSQMDIQQQISGLQQEVETLRSQNELIQVEMRKIKDIFHKQMNRNSMQKQLQQNQFNSELASKNMDIQSLINQINYHQQTVNDMNQQIQYYQTLNQNLRMQRQAQQQKLQSQIRQNIEVYHQKQSQILSEIQQRNQQIESIKRQTVTSKAQIQKMRRQIQEKSQQIRSLNAQKTNLQKNIADIIDHLDEKTRQNDEKQLIVQRIAEQLESTRQQLAIVLSQLDRHNQSKKNMRISHKFSVQVPRSNKKLTLARSQGISVPRSNKKLTLARSQGISIPNKTRKQQSSSQQLNIKVKPTQRTVLKDLINIEINIKDNGLVYVGQKIIDSRTKESYYTHKFVKLQIEQLPLIQQYYKSLLKVEEGLFRFPISEVLMKKDRYRGKIYYGLRFYKWYNKEPIPTRIGINLSSQQITRLIKDINHLTS